MKRASSTRGSLVGASNNREVGIFSRFRSGGLLHQGALVFGASMFLAVCGFAYHAIASRGLGVQQYGTLYALISAYTAAGLPGAILAPVIARFSAEFRALHDDSHLKGLAIGVGMLAVVFGSAAMVLSIILAIPIAGFLHVASWLVPFIGAMTALGFASGALRSFVQGMQAYIPFGLSCVAEGASKLAFVAVFIAMGLGVAYGALALISGFVMSAVFVAVYLARRFQPVASAAVRYDWKRIAIAGTGATSLTIAVTLLGSVDVVLVKHYFSASEAGIYSVASLVGKILLYFVAFIPTILLPQATDRHSRGERTRVVLGACLVTFIVVAFCGLLFFRFFGLIVLHALAGHQFDAAATLLVPYGAAMVCLSLIAALGTYGIATHRMLFSVPLVIGTAAILLTMMAFHPNLDAVVNIMLLGTVMTALVVAATLAAQGLAGERAKARLAA